MRVSKEQSVMLCTIADIAIVKIKGAAEATPFSFFIWMQLEAASKERH